MGRGRVRGGGEGEEGGGEGRGIPVSEVVTPPYTNTVCVGMKVSCK